MHDSIPLQQKLDSVLHIEFDLHPVREPREDKTQADSMLPEIPALPPEESSG